MSVGGGEVWCYDTRIASWRVFDYRYWNIIGPIAEEYDCFPHQYWEAGIWTTTVSAFDKANFQRSPQLAIAMHIINRYERTKTEKDWD